MNKLKDKLILIFVGLLIITLTIIVNIILMYEFKLDILKTNIFIINFDIIYDIIVYCGILISINLFAALAFYIEIFKTTPNYVFQGHLLIFHITFGFILINTTGYYAINMHDNLIITILQFSKDIIVILFMIFIIIIGFFTYIELVR